MSLMIFRNSPTRLVKFISSSGRVTTRGGMTASACLKERPMRRAIQVSLLVLAFSVLNIGLSATGFAQDAAGQDNVIKRDVDLVSLYFTVRDNKKQLASQLVQGEFRVLEDGKEQPIKFFAHHSDVVLNVGVLLDTGTSMAWYLYEEDSATSIFKHTF